MVINNTDKNIGPAFADSITSKESRQDLYDIHAFFEKSNMFTIEKEDFILAEFEHFQKILCHLEPSYRQDWLQLGTTR